MSSVQVFYEITPNPQSLKFITSKLISEESATFTDSLKTGRSPLAQKIFGFPWASGVFIGPNFITITKQDWVDWDVIADPLCDLIQEHIESGEAVLNPEVRMDDDSIDSPIVKKIKDIFNHEIRPAVAMDGGDIIFQKYQDNNVYVHMQGACSGCPSSTMTLKVGIETRLKEAIPEINEVISI